MGRGQTAPPTTVSQQQPCALPANRWQKSTTSQRVIDAAAHTQSHSPDEIGGTVRGTVALVALSAGLVLLAAACGPPPTRTNLTSSAPPSTRVEACISRGEADAHWRATGRDLKPDASCDAEPGNVPDADQPHAPGTVPHEHRSRPPTTFVEAQRELDPHDDPHIILRRQPDGTWAAMVVAVTGGDLPKWVRTSRDLKKWVASDDG